MGRIVATKEDWQRNGFNLTPECLYILSKNAGNEGTTIYYLHTDEENGGQYFSTEKNDSPGFVSKEYFGEKADVNQVLPHRYWLDVSKKCRWTKHLKKEWFVKAVREHPELFPGYTIIELPDKVRSTKGIKKDLKLKARQKQRREEKKLMETLKADMKVFIKENAEIKNNNEEN